ncbi:MAG: zinc metallopeptidase [Peptostreptococcaceae bacterium]|nr:zinc metallopeptidase [Peptostreptococcaceae bacterium]
MYYPYGLEGLVYLLPAFALAIYAQFKVKSTFSKYLKVPTQKGVTGYETARTILDHNGLSNVDVEIIPGNLSDHYDPMKRVVRLSDQVARGNSIASVSVAAHETGHAIQHSKNYVPLSIRSMIAPAASFSMKFVWVLVFAGIFLGMYGLITIGIILYTVAILFQIVTLPVEFNASSRALVQLEDLGIVNTVERDKSKRVLNAAALTYVAAAAVSLAQLMRLLILRNNRRG